MKSVKNLYDDLNWETATGYPEGTKRKVLRNNDDKGETILLKLPKGFYMGLHSHITTEQHFVLEGSYKNDGINYPTGSYQVFMSGENHGPFESETGALILVMWDAIK